MLTLSAPTLKVVTFAPVRVAMLVTALSVSTLTSVRPKLIIAMTMPRARTPQAVSAALAMLVSRAMESLVTISMSATLLIHAVTTLFAPIARGFQQKIKISKNSKLFRFLNDLDTFK